MISEKDLFHNLEGHSVDDIIKIYRAYDLAKELHDGQFRKSGEPYIIHPVNVAYILTQLNADSDTVCAGLLHDTLEDTDIKKEELSEKFNPTIAELVDGVTKIRRIHFQSKRDQNLANTRKIITSLTNDVRIIIIKLADRLHNMRTLEFHKLEKQKEIALETMEIFVPLANLVGSYWLKSELEDLSLLYLKPEEYKKYAELRHKQEVGFDYLLEEMMGEIKKILQDNGINGKMAKKLKNIYGIYKRFEEGNQLHEIPDLLSLKVIVDSIPECYYTLGLVHSLYHPLNPKFKDYICTPKRNLYRSLHTTVFGPQDRLVQTRIRTIEMDNIAYNGLTANWNLTNDKERNNMQDYFKKNFWAYNSVREIDEMFTDNDEFITQVRGELFSDKIYVYAGRGEMIELPKGATAVDFAFKIMPNFAKSMRCIYINGEQKPFNTELKTGDMVSIDTKGIQIGIINPEDAITAHAKRKIRENK